MVSLGRTDLGFVWTLVRIGCTLIGTLIACQISIEVMTWTQVLLAFVFLFAYWRMMVYRMIQLPLGRYLGAVGYPFLASMAAAICTIPLHAFGANDIPLLGWVNMALFAVAYMLFYWFTRRDYVREVVGYVFKR